MFDLLWMDEVRLHHFETMVETITFVGIYRGIISAGGAGFRLSTVRQRVAKVQTGGWLTSLHHGCKLGK